MNFVINNIFYFWKNKQFIFLEKFDNYIGAGTFHFLNIYFIIKKKNFRIFFLQNCFRQFDCKQKINKKLCIHNQIQILCIPVFFNFLNVYINSIFFLKKNFSFLKDNWNSPILGAKGIGFEVYCKNIEISQITLFYFFGNKKIKNPILEITYGVERIFFLKKKKFFFNEKIFSNYFIFNNKKIKKIVIYIYIFIKNYKKKKTIISFNKLINLSNYFNIIDYYYLNNNFNRIKILNLIKFFFTKIIEKI